MTDAERIRRAEQAKALLENPLWAEAWEAYRQKLFDVIDKTDSNEAETILQAKRLLAAGKAARGYFERLIQDGAVAAKTIELERQHRSGWFQRKDAA